MFSALVDRHHLQPFAERAVSLAFKRPQFGEQSREDFLYEVFRLRLVQSGAQAPVEEKRRVEINQPIPCLVVATHRAVIALRLMPDSFEECQ